MGAAEPVPYLCAISLKSSDEESSKPKRVFRETNQGLAECQEVYTWESILES